MNVSSNAVHCKTELLMVTRCRAEDSCWQSQVMGEREKQTSGACLQVIAAWRESWSQLEKCQISLSLTSTCDGAMDMHNSCLPPPHLPTWQENQPLSKCKINHCWELLQQDRVSEANLSSIKQRNTFRDDTAPGKFQLNNSHHIKRYRRWESRTHDTTGPKRNPGEAHDSWALHDSSVSLLL